MKAKDYKAVLLDLLIKYGVQATSARTTTDKSTDTKTVAYRVCGADKDILTFKKFVGTICAAISMADQVGYRYIVWNDRVYEIVDRAAVDTGLTLDDFESTAIHR